MARFIHQTEKRMNHLEVIEYLKKLAAEAEKLPLNFN